MVSYLEDGEWTSPEPLNEYINEPGSENKQPFVTKGGDTLFFSSNRPGGLGGSDIWMSLKGLEAESWTPAINMGAVINSPEEEISPYYSSANNSLLFASDGHVGYGGFDIYLAKGVSFFEPEIYNLGSPFNSTLDDTYFMISDSVGFLASNRNEQNKILNIYTFDIGDEALFLSLLISGESLIDSRIVSRFRDVRSLDLVTFRVEDYQGFEFFEPVEREKPRPDLVVLADTLESDSIQSVLGGRSQDLIAANVQARNNQANQRNQNRPGVVVPKFDADSNSDPDYVARENSNTEKSLKEASTSSGSSAKNERGESTREESYSNQSYDPSFSSIDLAFGKRLNRQLIKYETLYFDYELYDIRPEAQQALISLINQLAGRQYQQISILAYSDNTGGAEYNLELSRQRGESVKKYLQSRGIPEGKLMVLPRGEITNEEDHWFKRIMSRKVEIIIHPVHPFTLRTAKTFIVRKENTIQNIAGQLGLTEEQLKSWNGLNQEKIGAGNTIRVYEPGAETDINFLVSEDAVGQFKEAGS
ncbi:MAG: OmpA family protein [Bacteroidota bacterium]